MSVILKQFASKLSTASIATPSRSFSSTNVAFAGQKFRLQNGLGRSGNEVGPLHDLPDFHFADGRPAPETSTQRRWKRRRVQDVERAKELMKEMEEDIKIGNVQQFY